MRSAAQLRRRSETPLSGEEMAEALSRELGGPAHLAFLFASGLEPETVRGIAEEFRLALAPQVFLGCTSESVLSTGREVEMEPAVSVWAGHLPGAELHPFRLGNADWVSTLDDPAVLRKRVLGPLDPTGVVLLGDPFSSPAEDLLSALGGLVGQAPVVGGMASAGRTPGGNLLLLDDQEWTEGAVGVSLGGALGLEAIVSQGCRPVGGFHLVTGADGNFVTHLSGRPALEVVQEVFDAASPGDQELMEAGLMAGLVIEEYADLLGRGSTVVRNILGADPSTGALALGDVVQPGQPLQLQVRDADSADEEFRRLLSSRRLGAPVGALLFTCNGRGSRLFGEAGHDVASVDHRFPGLPLSGFFAAGEVGPVGGRSFLHGHTASLALFTHRPG